MVHQEPDKHAKQKHRGDKVGLLSQRLKSPGMIKLLRLSSCAGSVAQTTPSHAAWPTLET